MSSSFYLAGAARMARVARTTDNPRLRQWALSQGKEYLLLATFCPRPAPLCGENLELTRRLNAAQKQNQSLLEKLARLTLESSGVTGNHVFEPSESHRVSWRPQLLRE